MLTHANLRSDRFSGSEVRSGEVRIRIASSRAELFSAFRLVYQAYLQSGLTLPKPYPMRVTPFHLLPTTEVFVGIRGNQVVCTVSLVRDGRLGLPLESAYADNVKECRAHGIRLAEVSCLADRRVGPGLPFSATMRLMSFTAQCARQRGVDELLIAVHPRHARFYQRFLAFEQIGDQRRYDAVCDHPAIALKLDLKHLASHNPAAYQKLFSTRFPGEAFQLRPIAGYILRELERIVATDRGRPRRPLSGLVSQCA